MPSKFTGQMRYFHLWLPSSKASDVCLKTVRVYMRRHTYAGLPSCPSATTMADGLTVFVLLLIGTFVYFVDAAKRQRSVPLPPGPKPLPLVGNLLDLPKEQPWFTYRDWANKYGSDILYLDLPRQPTVVVNSVQVALDLMEKRSKLYSDRYLDVMDELTGWNWNFAFQAYSQRWRDTRRCFHQHFNQNAVSRYRPVQARAIRHMLKRALGFTEAVDVKSISLTFATTILEVTYGVRIHSLEDELALLSQKAVEAFVVSKVPGAFWVEFFPWLKHVPAWMPGSKARQVGDYYKPFVEASRTRPFDAVAEAVSAGTALPSASQKLIEKIRRDCDRANLGQDAFNAKEQVAKDAMGVAYVAAIDTQTAATCWFLVAMSLAPEVQRKAQAELDAVVGPGRLPTAEDVSSLPYVQAIFLESMRWAPVTPLGVQHRLIEGAADEYGGYIIPGGSAIIPNIWAMLHNPVDYPEPEQFNPDRFMLDGRLNPKVKDPFLAAFGFGRRICAGRHLAIDTLKLLFASILCVYNIESTLPEGGRVAPQASTGLISLACSPTFEEAKGTDSDSATQKMLTSLANMATPIYARRQGIKPLPPLRAARNVYDMSSTSNEVITTILVSNLHCSSCVHTIESVLGSLTPVPNAVDVSIVTQAVTVRHSHQLSPSAIKAAIDEAGFDIASTPPPIERQSSFTAGLFLVTPRHSKRVKHFEQCKQCQAEKKFPDLERDKLGEDISVAELRKFSTDSASTARLAEKAIESEKVIDDEATAKAFSTPGPPPTVSYRVTLSVGGMTCASCSNTITELVSSLPGVFDVAVNLLGNSAVANIDHPDRAPTIVTAIEDAGYEAEVASINPNEKPRATRPPHDGLYRVTLSVGGMTCMSCVNTITQLVEDIPGVQDVAVNLIGNSATATLTRQELADNVVTTIEDAGYEAEVVTVEPLTQEASEVGPRTVDLRIDGMFCPHCPEKVTKLLDPIMGRITVDKPLISHTDPILRLTYVPSPPDFTIRSILDTICQGSSSLSHPFTASIHHPPTLEERARRMHAREQRSLLMRLIFAIVVAIPTFIIGVVYMSLVPHSDRTRLWWMRPMWTGNASRVQWAMFFLATPVMFYSAGLYHMRSIKEIWALWKKGSRVPVWRRFVQFGSMNLLVSTGVSVAYFSSIALLAIAASQKPSPDGNGDSTTYFDSVVFLTMFLLMGRFLEAYSKGRTADAITALGKLRPTTALLLIAGSSKGRDKHSSPSLTISASQDPERGSSTLPDWDAHTIDDVGLLSVARVPAELLEVGDIVRVQHGASPPADGTLVAIMGDSASFDESSLTGESRLVKKELGEKVFVGTINRDSIVDVKVDAVGGETMLDHVVNVVREGQTRRAPIERVMDVITGYFVPVVTLLAVITWVIWLALGFSGTLPASYLDISTGGWTVWSLEFAIAVFVVACPCGIGLAAPTALLVGSGLAAKSGILVRGGGEAFQEAAQLDLIVFDKTGTLTEGGDPRVTDAKILSSSLKPDVILGIAAELESASTHPLASAIQAHSESNGATPQKGSSLRETAGRGLYAKFDGLRCEAIIGNEAWMDEHAAAVEPKLGEQLSIWKSAGKSVVLLAVHEDSRTSFEVYAAFAVADPLRQEAKTIVAALQTQGLSTWMISGDNAVTATAVAREVGIPEQNVIAGVLPHEKAQKVMWLQQVGMKRPLRGWLRCFGGRRLNTRCIVAMVGDGINDAPALTAADVGIAIGSGSDVAISSASFILVSSNLFSLLTLFDLSRTVFNRVKFNFLWATIYNLVALPIAAGVIYPAGHARLAPVWASLAMALSSVSVVCSSLLLKLYREPATPSP
ncbi:hypothetical protein NM688_g1273 [Phlebia brevispora]|uniref:Uncharacterized protein n=1 Tax=Phlebia brevispora TaxID=194682 RepID=A0ACC1TBN6_9APHY|nr:hypothetical protein NM688_g1273 [Phlebia brevispora]